MGRPIDIDERDFENMNPTVIKITFLFALAANNAASLTMFAKSAPAKPLVA